METFYKASKQIIAFCVICLIFSMATDEKTTQRMILLVLLGAVLINADVITDWLAKF